MTSRILPFSITLEPFLVRFVVFHRYKFESAKVLTTLRCLIKAMYRKEPYDKKQSDTLLPLDTLYEMLISHSQFLDLLLSDGPSGNKDVKGFIKKY